MNKLTEKSVIQLILNSKKFNTKYDTLLPNTYYYLKRIEADLLGITKSDYVYEYEIKLSRPDLLADKKKSNRLTRKYLQSIGCKVKTPYDKTKHEWLYLGSLLPNYFTYIIKEGIGDIRDIPEWSGLIFVTNTGKFVEVRKPKKLHSRKLDINTKLKLYKKFVYRYNRRLINEK